MEYTCVKFTGNNNQRWDGWVGEVPAKTVTPLGTFADGLENAEVRWPSKKGKGPEIWRALIVKDDQTEVGVVDSGNTSSATKCTSSSKRKRQRQPSDAAGKIANIAH